MKLWTNRSYIIRLLAVAAAYIITAKLGLSLAFATEQVTTVWPPTGLALVALLVLGYRYWPGIMLGAFVANILTHEPWLVASGIALGNTLEALVGVFLLKRVAGIQTRQLLTTTRNVLSLLVLGGLVSTLIAATIGTLSLALGGIVVWAHYWSVWPVWWVGDMMGDLIFAPVFLCLAYPVYWSQLKRRPLEAGAMLATICVISVAFFAHGSAAGTPFVPFPYMLFPVLIWAALRFTQAGVVASMLIVAMAAIWGTVDGLGPFTQGPTTEANLIQLQIFLIIASLTSLLVATVVSERLRVTEALRQAQREMVKELEQRKILERMLQEAHSRATNILADVLETKSPHRRAGK